MNIQRPWADTYKKHRVYTQLELSNWWQVSRPFNVSFLTGQQILRTNYKCLLCAKNCARHWYIAPAKRSFRSAWKINTQREHKHDMDSNRRKGDSVWSRSPREKILEWNVEGQMLITHRECSLKGHYTKGKEWIKSWNQNAWHLQGPHVLWLACLICGEGTRSKNDGTGVDHKGPLYAMHGVWILTFIQKSHFWTRTTKKIKFL